MITIATIGKVWRVAGVSLLICLLSLSPARAQVTVSGSVQSDVLIPQEDEAIGATTDSDWGKTNTYVDLKLQYTPQQSSTFSLDAGVRGLKFALAALSTLQTIIRVVGEHELEHRAACVDHAHGVGADHHVGHTFSDAGGSQVTTAGNLHDTNTTSTGFVVDIHALEFKVAKGGDRDTQLLCGLKNSCTFRHFNFSVIYC